MADEADGRGRRRMIPAGLKIALVLGAASGAAAALALSGMAADGALVVEPEFRRGEPVLIKMAGPADTVVVTGLFGEPVADLAVSDGAAVWDQLDAQGGQVFDGAYKITAYSGAKSVGTATVHVFDGGLAEWWRDMAR